MIKKKFLEAAKKKRYAICDKRAIIRNNVSKRIVQHLQTTEIKNLTLNNTSSKKKTTFEKQ